MFVDEGMVLRVGDYALCHFKGYPVRVLIAARSTGWASQTSVMLVAFPYQSREDKSNPYSSWPWLDSGWFSPVFAHSGWSLRQ